VKTRLAILEEEVPNYLLLCFTSTKVPPPLTRLAILEEEVPNYLLLCFTSTKVQIPACDSRLAILEEEVLLCFTSFYAVLVQKCKY
jgi:hypothetical protein